MLLPILQCLPFLSEMSKPPRDCISRESVLTEPFPFSRFHHNRFCFPLWTRRHVCLRAGKSSGWDIEHGRTDVPYVFAWRHRKTWLPIKAIYMKMKNPSLNTPLMPWPENRAGSEAASGRNTWALTCTHIRPWKSISKVFLFWIVNSAWKIKQCKIHDFFKKENPNE